MTDFKNIPLPDIHPDPNQPRKFYDDVAMAELTQSVKEKGVIQPIVIRPNGNGYILVVGERRYRASQAAGLADIPAVIRNLSDEDALELQIIENLQRKDVHPMEEAVAFKSLIERKNHALTVEEIAIRVGKKPFFVRQRLKLNSLTKEWQEAYFHNLVSGSYMMAVSLLPEESQKALAKEEQLSAYAKEGRRINENTWSLNKYRGDLNKATFDLKDPSLSPMGACTTCPFNSAVASLFPEDVKHPVCNKISDYALKTDEAFKRNFKLAKEDPATVLISRKYYVDQKEIAKFEKDGSRVYKSGEYEILDVPEPPDVQEIREDDELSEEQKVKELEEETKRYEDAKAKFDKKVQGGKFIKGFCVIADRDEIGQTFYITLTKKGTGSPSSKATAAKEEEGSLTAEDINSEIERIRDREKRAKELDGEKVHTIVKEILSNPKPSLRIATR
jgi:ParB family chromosome partitioning protein